MFLFFGHFSLSVLTKFVLIKKSVKEVEKKIGEDESKIITAITGLKNDGLLKISKNNIIEII